MTGVHDARGYESAQGNEMENWLDYGNGDFKGNPALQTAQFIVLNISVQRPEREGEDPHCRTQPDEVGDPAVPRQRIAGAARQSAIPAGAWR